MTSTDGKTKLTTLLGNYPNAMALKKGEVKSGLVDFDFADVKVSNTAFKPLVRDAKFDVAELAIVPICNDIAAFSRKRAIRAII